MYSLHEVEHILRNKQVFVCSLAFLGEGEHSEAFLVNRDIVVKLPKHRQASECLKTEMQVVKGLGKNLNVEIPSVLFQGAFFHEGEEYTYFWVAEIAWALAEQKTVLRLAQAYSR